MSILRQKITLKKLTVNEARALFKHRTNMTRYTKFNYKNNPQYAKQLWKCENCENISTESHILWCSGFQHLREGKDLKSDKDLAKYLQAVVKIRSRNEDDSSTKVTRLTLDDE